MHGLGVGHGGVGLVQQGVGHFAGEAQAAPAAADGVLVGHGVQPHPAGRAAGQGGAVRGGTEKRQREGRDEQVLQPVGEQGEGQAITS